MSPAIVTASTPLSRNHVNAASRVCVLYVSRNFSPPGARHTCTSESAPNDKTGFPPVKAPGGAEKMRRGPSANALASPPRKKRRVSMGGDSFYRYLPAKKRMRRATCAAQASMIGSASLSGGTNAPLRSPNTFSVDLM